MNKLYIYNKKLRLAEPGAGRGESGQSRPGHPAAQHCHGQHTRHERSCAENHAQVYHHFATGPFQTSVQVK
jgi:hypothetical protein